MSFFRRPGDDSSSEEFSDDEQELDLDVNQDSTRDSNGTVEDAIQADTTESLSLAKTISHGENNAPTSINEARDLITASLLEELAKYRATEELNRRAGADREGLIAKDSPEVQRLAREIFAKSTGVLAEVGVISAESASEQKKPERARYLTSLEKASYAGISNAGDRSADIPDTHGTLVRRPSQQPGTWQTLPTARTKDLMWRLGNSNGQPSTELSIAPLSAPLRFNSHYRSSFVERGVLGKGGFGKVFHSYNLYDQREYAIKKIPLSHKLSQNYTRGGLPALKHILKEVQALAKLEHCNIVRYHATWIEEPNTMTHSEAYQSPYAFVPYGSQRLLNNVPMHPAASIDTKTRMLITPFHEDEEISVGGKVVSATSTNLENDEDNPFAHSRADESDGRLLWSQQKASSISYSHADETDPFSDGRSHRRESLVRSTLLNDPVSNCYVLHVQMSMYPLTLAEYLLPVSSPRRRIGTHKARHCFHVVPALRLLLSILCGLQYIHSHGYIHRDIKPGNIFLSQIDTVAPNVFNLEQGYVDVGSCPTCTHNGPRFLNPRIGDFGLVAELQKAAIAEDILNMGDGTSASSENAVGTQFYRPPEHEQRPNLPDEKLDVFALGVVLLELLYYCSTSTGRQMLLKGCQIGAIPSDLGTQISIEGFDKDTINAIVQCLYGMLDLNPQRRWRCAMVKNAIENILTGISLQRSNTDPD